MGIKDLFGKNRAEIEDKIERDGLAAERLIENSDYKYLLEDYISKSVECIKIKHNERLLTGTSTLTKAGLTTEAIIADRMIEAERAGELKGLLSIRVFLDRCVSKNKELNNESEDE